MEYSSKIHCRYAGIRGFLRAYRIAVGFRYMITEKALQKVRILAFWERHGLQATVEAFGVKRRTLFLWKKKLREKNGKLEALNNASKAPHRKRQRSWPEPVTGEIRRLRDEHPNLGKDKLGSLLKKFCLANQMTCPSPSTIGRLMKDLGGLRHAPQKVTHFGRIKVRKKRKVLRKPRQFKALFPGHLVALDTIERFVNGCRRYLITFEDIFTRFTFAWCTTSHASMAAKEFFDLCRMVFPVSFRFVLTDNGSEFAKHFSKELLRLHLVHYHTYPRTPKMNAHVERFNRTIQEEFVNFHEPFLLNPIEFNRKLMEWLIWYNTERPHYAFKNCRSPLQFLLSLTHPQECNMWWTHTLSFKLKVLRYNPLCIPYTRNLLKPLKKLLKRHQFLSFKDYFHEQPSLLGQ